MSNMPIVEKDKEIQICINTYFTILKSNSRVENYKDMQEVYSKLVRIVVNDFTVKRAYKFIA